MLDHAPLLIAFGSNIDPLPNLWRGLLRLHEELEVCAVSTVYRTAALPDPNAQGDEAPGADFLNGAVRVTRHREPLALHTLLRSIEAELLRVRTPRRYAPRTLDLDIALMGEQVLHSDTLRVPDPDIPHRPFLAIPLAELAPQARHPLERCPLSHIAARFGPFPGGLTIDEPATRLLHTIVGHRP
ncbi:MAG: 2-amino-4-hydroxy-6-hydroxymethyldihydropteridine diphosphokinase [Magnetococcus sp. MYC-9]